MLQIRERAQGFGEFCQMGPPLGAILSVSRSLSNGTVLASNTHKTRKNKERKR